MNNKGFTLVELLVVIAVMGIVTGMVAPLVRNVQFGQENRKYETYLNSLVYGAKLYVNAYEEDLFGYERTGCAIITYENLIKKKLVKDIDIKDVSCHSEKTLVKVVKFDGQYTYVPQLGCGNKIGEELQDITVYPAGRNINVLSCDFEALAIMNFSTDPESSDSIDKKGLVIGLNLFSDTGVNLAPQIEYGFSLSQDGTVANNMWQPLNISIPSIKEQKGKIANGEGVLVNSSLSTFGGITGVYYLVLRISRLQDLAGRNYTKGDNPYVYLGPFKLDNEAPNFNDSQIASFNTNKPKINLQVTDNYSNAKDLQMCISVDTDICTDYVKYKTKTNAIKVSPNHDGSTHDIYVFVKDMAGNIGSKKFEYTVPSV